MPAEERIFRRERQDGKKGEQKSRILQSPQNPALLALIAVSLPPLTSS